MNILLYLVGSFIALDFNPTHWDMFTDTIGRLFFVALELWFIGHAVEEK